VSVFRFLLLAMLVASALSFALYATTGRVRYRVFGLRVLGAALIAGFIFFAVLIAQRL
jgi:hypothetical protein